MDTGLSAELETMIAKYGNRVQIGQDQEIGQWIAIERPVPSSQKFWHAPTLAELDIKLGKDFGSES
jgi:hypothetical protein